MELNEERINEIVEEVLSEMASLSAERDAEEQLRNFCDRVLLRRFGAAAVREARDSQAEPPWGKLPRLMRAARQGPVARRPESAGSSD